MKTVTVTLSVCTLVVWVVACYPAQEDDVSHIQHANQLLDEIEANLTSSQTEELDAIQEARWGLDSYTAGCEQVQNLDVGGEIPYDFRSRTDLVASINRDLDYVQRGFELRRQTDQSRRLVMARESVGDYFDHCEQLIDGIGR